MTAIIEVEGLTDIKKHLADPNMIEVGGFRKVVDGKTVFVGEFRVKPGSPSKPKAIKKSKKVEVKHEDKN